MSYCQQCSDLLKEIKEKDSRIAEQKLAHEWQFNIANERFKEIQCLKSDLAQALARVKELEDKLDEAYKVRFQAEKYAEELTGDFAKKTVALQSKVTKLSGALEKINNLIPQDCDSMDVVRDNINAISKTAIEALEDGEDK